MIGLLILGIAGAYLVVSLAVVAFAANRARAKGRSPWKWGSAAALVMYLLVFWDWIPTVVVHKYACATESGFWVYKTADQWKREHPGAFEALTRNNTLGTSEHPNRHSQILTFTLNQRFTRTISSLGILPLNRFRAEQTLVDTVTGEVLARYVDFSTGYGNTIEMGSNVGFQGFKLWLNSGSCGNGKKFEDDMQKTSDTYPGAKYVKPR